MDSHRKRSTLHRLSVVWPMNDNHEGPVPPGMGRQCVDSTRYTTFLSMLAPKRSRDDARNPWTAEPRIPRLELNDGLDKCLARPFGPGFFGHSLDENSRRYLRTHQRLMKRQERRGRTPMATFRIRPRLRKSAPNPNSSRSLAVRRGARWRGRRKTISCCLSQKILRDHRSHATGATQCRGHDGQVKQGEQEVLHARDSVGRRQAPCNVALILDSARELGIRDAQVADGASDADCAGRASYSLGRKVEAHHPEQGVQEPFGLAQREMVDESQGQGGLDGEIRVAPLPASPAAPAGRPGSDRFRGQPHRHIAASNEGPL